METGMAAGTYEEFRDDLKRELEKQVEGFVRIGYKLKLARDTEILEGSGYRDYKEFALREYRLSESVVSRYISINDRYSVNGNSEILREEYQGYGYTKLAEMLAIPDGIAENLDPSLGKMDIRQIAEEIKEENRITDLEVLMEGEQEDQKELTVIQKALSQYFFDQRKSFTELASVLGSPGYNAADPEKIMDVMAPAGTAVIFVRVKGIGKIMMHLKGMEQDIQIQNTRTMETVSAGWQEFCKEMKGIFSGRNLAEPEKAWEDIYQEPFGAEQPEPEKAGRKKLPKVVAPPKKEKIAPAQKEKEPEKSAEPEKLPDAEKNMLKQPQEEPEEKKPEEPSGQPEEVQIPGQDTILNHPEYLPKDYQTNAQVDGEPVQAEVEPTSSQRKEECLSLISTIQGYVTLEKYEEAYRSAGQLLEHLEVMKC